MEILKKNGEWQEVGIAAEEVPGFADLFEARMTAVSLGIEAEGHAGGDDFDGDIPTPLAA